MKTKNSHYHHDPDDKTVTHFTATKNKSNDGFFITLYRWKKRDNTGEKRLQYRGPLGWQFHCLDKDEDIIPNLHPIEKLPEITGDDLVKRVFNQDSLYAG